LVEGIQLKDGRYNFLLSYANNYLWLNQNISKEEFYNALNNVNYYACDQPIDKYRLNKIVNSLYEYKTNGLLKPILNWKKRKIVFNKNSTLLGKEKLAICRNEWAIKQASNSREKLRNIIENWDFELLGEITDKKIYSRKNRFQISKNTVEKYFDEFKEEIKKRNHQNTH
jgi:hypothetical protein